MEATTRAADHRSDDRSSAISSEPLTQVTAVDPAEALRFLQLLGKDPAQTYFRTFKPKGRCNGSRHGRDLAGFDAAALVADNEAGSAVYFITGDAVGATSVSKTTGKPSGCVHDADCPTVSLLFTEWDDKPIEWQKQAWQELNLPEPSVMVDTSGASIHNYWRLTRPMPAAEWRILQARLIAYCGGDKNCKNPSRLMRVPGFAYIDKATGKATGSRASIIHTSDNRIESADLAALLDSFEQQQFAEPEQPAPAAHHRDFPPRSLEEIEAAARYIPKRVVGANTYSTSRNALCGCAAALAEIGLPEEMALDLLESKWPDRATAQQVLSSTTSRKAQSFWAIASEHGYNLKRSPSSDDAVAGFPDHLPHDQEPTQEPAESFAAMLRRLPRGWHRGKDGVPVRSALAVGDLADMLPAHLLRYNLLSLEPEVLTTGGWMAAPRPAVDGAHIILSQLGWKIGKETAVDAILYVAHKQEMHPVREYLLQLEARTNLVPFDLDMVAPRFLRATSPLHVAMVRKWIIGAAERALQPGCKMDYVLTLQSDLQGMLKSTFFEVLSSPDWFNCTLPDTDKDLTLNLHCCWIFELAELEAVTGRRESGRLKNLVTTSTDVVRVPYGAGPERKKRPSVFAATVNERTFLRDQTGNRRFWVVPIQGNEPIDVDSLASARDAIWKAAVLAVRAGEKPMLPRQLEVLSEQQNENYIQEDAWLSMLLAWMDGDPMVRFDPERDASQLRYDAETPFTSAEVLYSAGLKRSDQITRADEMRVAPLLRSLGFEKDRSMKGGQRAHKWCLHQSAAQPVQPAQPGEGEVGQLKPTAPQPISTIAQPTQPVPAKGIKRRGEEELGEAKGRRGVVDVGQVGQQPPTPCARTELSCPTSDKEVGQGWAIAAEVGQSQPAEPDPVLFDDLESTPLHAPVELMPSAPALAAPPADLQHRLLELRRQQPHAYAACLALALDPQGTGRPTGREVRLWLPWADQQLGGGDVAA